MNMRSAALSCACLAGFCAPAANAIEAAPIIVDAPELATVPPPEVAAAAIRRTPGGVDLVPATVYLDGHAVNLHDMLAFSPGVRSEEHTSELQSLMRISYAVFCLKKKKKYTQTYKIIISAISQNQEIRKSRRAQQNV